MCCPVAQQQISKYESFVMHLLLCVFVFFPCTGVTSPFQRWGASGTTTPAKGKKVMAAVKTQRNAGSQTISPSQ